MHLYMEGKGAVRCRQGGDDDHRKSPAESVGGTKHKGRSLKCWFTWVWLAEID